MNAANPKRIHRNLIVRISVTGFIISVLFGFAALAVWEKRHTPGDPVGS